MKSIDYVKLVSTARSQRTGGRISDADNMLNAVVWWGAIINLVSTAAVGAGLSITGTPFDSDAILFPILGVIPALVYFAFWLHVLKDAPRFARLMIGSFAFIVSFWILYSAYKSWIEVWFALVPVGSYFVIISAVPLKQLSSSQDECKNDYRPPGGNAA